MEIHFSTCDTRRIYNTLLLQEAGLLKIGNFFLFLDPLPSSPIRSNNFFFSLLRPKSSQRSNRHVLSFISFLPSFLLPPPAPPPSFFLRAKSATKEKERSRSRINQSYDTRCFWETIANRSPKNPSILKRSEKEMYSRENEKTEERNWDDFIVQFLPFPP